MRIFDSQTVNVVLDDVGILFFLVVFKWKSGSVCVAWACYAVRARESFRKRCFRLWGVRLCRDV